MKKIMALTLLIIVIFFGFLVIRHRIRINNQNRNNPPPVVIPPSENIPSPDPDNNHISAYKSGTFSETISTGGRTRSYLLHIPIKFNPANRYPLVLAFHGGGGTGQYFLKVTGLTKSADANQFIAVAPDGIQKTWNRGGNELPAEKLGIDDVKFVRELITHLKAKLPVDEKRIYATGFSNGAALSYLLACRMADTFAAVGPAGSSMLSALIPDCSPTQPISIVDVHGVNDPDSPYDGGESGVVKNALLEGIPKTLEFWASKDNCNPQPTSEMIPVLVRDGTQVEKISYSNCGSGSVIVHYKVYGMGHAWPPSPTTLPRVQGPTSQNLNATNVIWEFFKVHVKK